MSASLLAAVVLAAVFAAAALAKLADPDETRLGFAALGLPQPDLLAWLIPVGELAVAGLLLLNRPWGSIVAFAALVGFTVFLVQLARSGHPAPCHCFGARLDRPVGYREVVRNLVLLGVALLAAL